MFGLLYEARRFPRDFHFLAAGQTISTLGTLMVGMALDLFVLHRTGSAIRFALMLAVQLVVPILFGPAIGEWVDAVKKKPLLMMLDGVRGLLSMVLCVDLLRGGSLSLADVYGAVFFYAACESVFDPTIAALVPKLIDDARLAKANTVYGALLDMSYALGPLLGAVAYGGVGLAGVLGLDGLSYLAAVTCEAHLHLVEKRTGTLPRFFKSYGRGFGLIIADRRMKYLLINDGLNHLFLFPFLSLCVPFLIIHVLQQPNWAYGAVGFFATIGSVASVGVSVRWERRYSTSGNVSRALLMLSGFSVFLVPFLWPGVLGVFRHLGGVWVAGYWGGADFELYLAFAIYLAFSTTLVQSLMPQESLGIFFASRATVQAVARLVGIVLYGLLLATFDPVVSVALLVAALLANVAIHVGYVKALRRHGEQNLAADNAGRM